MSRLAGAFLLATALSSVAQESPVFHAGVSLVRVDAEVTDGTRTLTGLGQDDFLVWDNGRPQSILHFSQEEDPLDVVLLFDISGSMRRAVEKLAAWAGRAFAELRPGDRVAVMVFNVRSRLITPLTEDLEAVERAVNDEVLALKFGGGTRILTGADDAALYFLSQPKGPRRRAVLIFTDNYGIGTKRESAVVTRFWEADALLTGIIIRTPTHTGFRWATRIGAPYLMLFAQGMTGVAEKTGGDVLKTDDPGPAFREMMQRIRRRYSLYFSMPAGAPGLLRKVRVELAPETKKLHPKARVRARKGYVMPAIGEASDPPATGSPTP